MFCFDFLFLGIIFIKVIKAYGLKIILNFISKSICVS